jgi:hypothetical protein
MSFAPKVKLYKFLLIRIIAVKIRINFTYLSQSKFYEQELSKHFKSQHMLAFKVKVTTVFTTAGYRYYIDGTDLANILCVGTNT